MIFFLVKKYSSQGKPPTQIRKWPNRDSARFYCSPRKLPRTTMN